MRSKVDAAVYTGREFIAVLHVDDFAAVGTPATIKKFRTMLNVKFLVGKVQVGLPLRFLAMDISEDRDGMRVDQAEYVREMADWAVAVRGRLARAGVDHTERLEGKACTMMEQATGMTRYLATVSRPDMAYAASRMAAGVKGTVRELWWALGVMAKLVRQPLTLPIGRQTGPRHVVAYTDAAWANVDGVYSQMGCFIIIEQQDGLLVPVLWESRKMTRIARSSLAAETQALVHGVDRVLWIQRLIEEMTGEALPVVMRVDCKNLADAVATGKMVQERRLMVDIAAIRADQEAGRISLEWVPAARQLADELTKTRWPTKLRAMMETGRVPVAG